MSFAEAKAYVNAKKSKLSFKGDHLSANPKKKKMNLDEGLEQNYEYKNEKEGWTKVKLTADLQGPLFITMPGNSQKCLVFDENGCIKVDDIEGFDKDRNSGEPSSAKQVILGQFLASGVFALKSAYGRYFASNKVGEVSVQREAVGPQEEWTPLLRDDGVAFQNVYEQFLRFDANTQTLRADAEEITSRDVFQVQCQAALQQKREIAIKKPKDGVENVSALEKEEIKRFQSSKSLKIAGVANGQGHLRKAKEEGRLREALLDRRSKIKSDKYCK